MVVGADAEVGKGLEQCLALFGRVDPRAREARRAHARDEEAVHGVGRVGRGHVEDAAAPARRREDLPQGRGLAVGGGDHAGRVGAGVEREEVEDAVLAGIDAGEGRGPSGRREVGRDRAQGPPGALVAQALEEGELSRVRPRADEVPRRAVQSHDEKRLGHA